MKSRAATIILAIVFLSGCQSMSDPAQVEQVNANRCQLAHDDYMEQEAQGAFDPDTNATLIDCMGAQLRAAVAEHDECRAHIAGFERVEDHSQAWLDRLGECFELLTPDIRLCEGVLWQVDTRIKGEWEFVSLHESLSLAQSSLALQKLKGYRAKLTKKVAPIPCDTE